MLAAQVRAGALPPVEKRLPAKPMTVRPTDRVGVYGGTWHSRVPGPDTLYPIVVQAGSDYLTRWSEDGSGFEPNLLRSWDVRGDGKEYTLHLREGIRWSDGAPFTADDLVFTHDDLLADTGIYPVAPSLIAPAGRPGSIEKLSDYAVRLTFTPSHGLFLGMLADPDWRVMPSPRHYLERFHKKYNPDADQLAKDAGFPGWVELLAAKNDLNLQNPDRPTLTAWQVSRPAVSGTGRGVYTRNPYYWKVDPQRRQLPYIDRVLFELISDPEVALLKVSNGEIDLEYPYFNPGVCLTRNKPVLAQNRQGGGYTFLKGVSASMNELIYSPNPNCKDPRLRAAFRNKDFRIGLSYAINRQEIIDTVYQRQGRPWQAAPRPESEFFDEGYAKQYTEYDVDEANRHLDAAGYTSRDSANYRTHPDGSRISFRVHVNSQTPAYTDNAELVKGYWKAVGLEVHVTAEDSVLEKKHEATNQHDISTWTGDGGYVDALFTPTWYLPTNPHLAPLWTQWYDSRGTDGERPPDPAVRQMELYDRVKETFDKSRRHELFAELLGIAKEQFWAIGTVLPMGTYGIVKHGFHNVPESMIAAWIYPTPGPTHPEQYYVDGSA